MGDMSYEDTQHLLDCITSPKFDQRLNNYMDGNAIEEAKDTKVPMFMGPSNSAFQNPQAHYEIENDLLTPNPFEREFMEACKAARARIPVSAGSDEQLSTFDNSTTVGEDDTQVPTSTTLTPATQFSSPMNPEHFLPESFQAQTYPPLYNQPQSYPVPMNQPFYDQTALEQMEPFPQRRFITRCGRQFKRSQRPRQQPIFTLADQLQQPLPEQTSHPTVQVSQPHIPSSRAPPRRVAAPGEPTRHKIPANITAYTSDQQWLLPKLDRFTHEYQGYITNPGQARRIDNVFLSLAHHEVKVTPVDMDPTFPRAHEAYRACVQELFNAIVDWSNTRGWRTKMGSKLAAQWVEEVKTYRKKLGLSVEPPDMLDHQIEPPLYRMPPVNEQWKNVVHRQLSNIEIEILSSKILVRLSFIDV
jgi:hypothetical protein